MRQNRQNENNINILVNEPNRAIIVINNVNPFRRRNIGQLNDEEKLDLLNDNLKDTNSQFKKLLYFYKLAYSVNELYDFDCYENKYLNNLLVSLYNIIFSPNNSNKIKDSNVIKSYKIIIETILDFYNTIFDNIINCVQNENIIKEFSKRRNIYHLKEIGECFNILKEPNRKRK